MAANVHRAPIMFGTEVTSLQQKLPQAAIAAICHPDPLHVGSSLQQDRTMLTRRQGANILSVVMGEYHVSYCSLLPRYIARYLRGTPGPHVRYTLQLTRKRPSPSILFFNSSSISSVVNGH